MSELRPLPYSPRFKSAPCAFFPSCKFSHRCKFLHDEIKISIEGDIRFWVISAELAQVCWCLLLSHLSTPSQYVVVHSTHSDVYTCPTDLFPRLLLDSPSLLQQLDASCMATLNQPILTVLSSIQMSNAPGNREVQAPMRQLAEPSGANPYSMLAPPMPQSGAAIKMMPSHHATTGISPMMNNRLMPAAASMKPHSFDSQVIPMSSIATVVTDPYQQQPVHSSRGSSPQSQMLQRLEPMYPSAKQFNLSLPITQPSQNLVSPSSSRSISPSMSSGHSPFTEHSFLDTGRSLSDEELLAELATHMNAFI